MQNRDQDELVEYIYDIMGPFDKFSSLSAKTFKCWTFKYWNMFVNIILAFELLDICLKKSSKFFFIFFYCSFLFCIIFIF